MELLNCLIQGISKGSIYALVALGYSMVYGIVKLINFAHGDIMMVGAYMVWFGLSVLKLPFAVAVLFSVMVCAVLGVVIEKLAYKPLRKSARISLLITAIGISLLLQNVIQLVFEAKSREVKNYYPAIFSEVITIGGFAIEITTIITIVVSVISMVALWLFITKTKMGKAMRAVSEDTATAKLMGINVDRVISFTFFIGSILASIAAILFVGKYSNVTRPTMGSMLGLKAFIAAVFGGIGSVPGAVLGGFAIGILESVAISYISPSYSDAIVFGILILVLLFRPNGIFGSNVKEKV